MSPVDMEVTDHVATILIDRPEVANSLRPSDEAVLAGLLRRAQDDRSVWAVVLTGTGGVFCAGADLKNEELSGTDYWARVPRGGFGGLGADWLTVPVIARVNGHALGGGLEMVLSADIAVAVDDATFGFTEARVGHVPAGGAAPAAARNLAGKRAMALLLTGRRLSAAEALRGDVVTEVVAGADLDSAVARWLDDVLACAPLALRATKSIVRRTAALPFDQAAATMTPELRESMCSADAAEGPRSFRERRPANWSGR